MKWRVLLLAGAYFILATPILAQQFTAGIKAGAQTTGALTFASGTVPFSPSFDHFTFGPEVGVVLPDRLGLEFNALHAHYAEGGLVGGSPVGLVGFADTHVSYWDFPLLLKWRASSRSLSPFVTGGLAVRHTGVIQHATSFTTTPLFPEPLSVNTWTRGPVVGGGLEYAVRHIHVSAEIRYTHWTEPALGVPTMNPAGPVFALQANTNDVEILLGLTFGNR